MKQRTIITGIALLLFASIISADTYKYQPGDFIDLYVYNSPELCGEFRISADGFVRLPLLGKVHVAGMSEEETYEVLRSVVGKYLIDPKITISVKFSISVMGYVIKPGIYTVTDSERLIEVIALAGGYTSDASGWITVYREGHKIDISKDTVLEKNSSLGLAKPGDIIFVRRKLFTRSDYSLILSTLSAISIAVYYFSR